MLSKHILANRTRPITSTSFTFENLIDRNCLYVDKTQYFWNMLNSVNNMYFLSRPRRFGKSLTISTLKAIFQGKKELFKDLFIYDQPYDWKTYPVIHLDMGSNAATTPELLEGALLRLIKRQANELGVELSETLSNACFEELIYKLYERDGKVVILIDEYDKPILNNIEKPNLSQLQEIMKGFYSVLKTCEPYERFVFITGVGKFFKVSIFSDLNNLTDISMHDDYAEMCGYTEKELEDNFHGWFEEIANKTETNYRELLKDVKKWYDGYKFSENAENVYNPVSLAKFIDNKGKFKNYWFETGSPSILIKLLKNTSFDLDEIINKYQGENIFTAFEPSKISLIALMYQTGYITIKDTIKDDILTLYKLGFPNFEVEESFYKCLLEGINSENNIYESLYVAMRLSLSSGDLTDMMKRMDSFFAGISYAMYSNEEKLYHMVFFIILKLMGAKTDGEVCTSDGRIDAVVEKNGFVYLFEFKIDKTEEIAINQIISKKYFKPYLTCGKKIIAVGVNFDSNTRRMAGWKQETITE